MAEWSYRLVNITVPIPISTKADLYELVPMGRRTKFLRQVIMEAVEELKNNA